MLGVITMVLHLPRRWSVDVLLNIRKLNADTQRLLPIAAVHDEGTAALRNGV